MLLKCRAATTITTTTGLRMTQDDQHDHPNSLLFYPGGRFGGQDAEMTFEIILFFVSYKLL